MRKIKFFASLTLLASLSTAAFSAETRWFTVSYGGQTVGFCSSTVDGFKTISKQKLVFKRLGSSLTMLSDSSLLEDSIGNVSSFHGEMSSSNSKSTSDGAVHGKFLKLRSTAGGRAYDREIPLNCQLLGPQREDAATSAALVNVGDKFNCLTVEPISGAVITVQRSLAGVEELKMMGQTISCLRVNEVISEAGINHTIWLDRQGHLVRSKDQTALGEAIYELTDSATAVAAGKGGTLGDEVYSRSVAKTNIRLPDPRSLQKVVLKLTNRRPELGWPELNSETQRVLRQDSKTALVEVIQSSIPSLNQRHSSPTGMADYISSNSLIQSDDPGVIKLANSIVAGERDPWKKATRLRDWEAKNMHFDAGIAVAPSSEVARDRRGTCFAYSTLLAAMCRAVGIPSRFVLGLGYAEGMYGGHAWVDIRIGDRWIPIDAALTQPNTADAARLRFVSSSLTSGMSEVVLGLKNLGNLDIQVVSFTRNGKTVRVPDHAAPYQVSQSTYKSQWLGIQVCLPSNFKFNNLNCFYPDSTIFTATDGHVKLTLEQVPASFSSLKGKILQHRRVAGLKASIRASGTEATAEILDGQSVWAFRAEGHHARETLTKALNGWKRI